MICLSCYLGVFWSFLVQRQVSLEAFIYGIKCIGFKCFKMHPREVDELVGLSVCFPRVRQEDNGSSHLVAHQQK